jgi:sporulation protein YlmC with PRC-barrel domain
LFHNYSANSDHMALLTFSCAIILPVVPWRAAMADNEMRRPCPFPTMGGWVAVVEERAMLDGEFKNLAVVSVQEAKKLGSVEDLQLDVREHHVDALLLHGGLFRGGPMVPWTCVTGIGHDAVMVDASSDAVARTAGDTVMRLDALKKTQVVGDNGELAGTIDGVDIDPDTGKVLAYIVTAPAGGGLFHQAPRFRVEPLAIKRIGPQLITIDASTVNFQSTS